MCADGQEVGRYEYVVVHHHGPTHGDPGDGDVLMVVR
eukprot:COSAG04_NODE_17480_length_468_cov_1.111111_1_plen_36_part_01